MTRQASRAKWELNWTSTTEGHEKDIYEGQWNRNMRIEKDFLSEKQGLRYEN